MFWHDTVSLVKIGVSFLLAFLCLIPVYKPEWFDTGKSAKTSTIIGGSVVAFRLIPFIFIFLVLGFAPRSDTAFFYTKALAAFEGKMVYRDFLSYHSPLFGYFISLPLFLWNDARVLILLMIVMEAIIVGATYRYYRTERPDSLRLLVLYYMLPLPFVAMILSSEEDIWIWGYALLSVWLSRNKSNSSLWIGLMWGVAMITVKSMIIVLLPAAFFLVNDKIRYVAGLLLIGLPTVVILYLLMGDAFLMPIQHSGYNMSPNMVSVTRPLLGWFYNLYPLTRFNTAGMLITMGWSSYVAYQYRHLGYTRAFPLLFVFTFTLFMLAEPSAPGYYLFTHLLPIIFLLGPQKSRRFYLRLAFFNILLVVQPIMQVLYADMVLYDSWSIVFSKPIYTAEYFTQVIEVFFLISLFRDSLRALKEETLTTTQITSAVLS